MIMNESDRKDFFDQRAHIWDEISPHDLEVVNMLADALEFEGHEKVLDIGTGTGIMIPYYRQRTSGGITALDMSEKMIEVAMSKYPSEEYDVEYVVSDLYEYDPAKRFDIIVCYSCFPHFTDKVGAIRHLASLLKDGGKMMISHGCSRDHINHVHEQSGDTVCDDRLPDMGTMRSMMESVNLTVIWSKDDERTFSLIGVK
jgi:2-polyprenyl-3-methyl-5-hydroxy-6-metoxy-1,4-benzoquinol methylase